jgi:flagellar basal-body rod modification protein FlgD
VVRTAALGSNTAGEKVFSWDGFDNSGTLLPAGAYTFAIRATAANGTALTATTYTTGKVDGVNLSGSTPQLTIGTTSVALSDVISMGV